MDDISKEASLLAIKLADQLPQTLFDRRKRAEMAVVFAPHIEAALRRAQLNGVDLAKSELERVRTALWDAAALSEQDVRG